MKKVGILSLQGGFSLHANHVLALGLSPVMVRKKSDFANIDSLIIPGGESSVMLKAIDFLNITDTLSNFVKNKPTYGTCAGAILLAGKVSSPEQFSFGAIDIEIARNGYGSQNDSFVSSVGGYEVCFIRAPIITKTGLGVEVLATHCDSPTWVKSGNIMVTTFHPECNAQALPSPMHRMFANMQ